MILFFNFILFLFQNISENFISFLVYFIDVNTLFLQGGIVGSMTGNCRFYNILGMLIYIPCDNILVISYPSK